MSFDWNLSSDEEDDFEHWAEEQLQQKHSSLFASKGVNTKKHHPEDADDVKDDDGHSSTSSDEEERKPAAFDTNTMAFPSDFDASAQEEEDDDEIDWEEAEQDHSSNDQANAAATTAASMPKAAVTIDMNSVDTNFDKKKNESLHKHNNKLCRSKTVFRHHQLSRDLQFFLSQVHRAHLLCLISHTVFASRYASSHEVLHVAHSLIPLAWMNNAPPPPPSTDTIHASKQPSRKEAPTLDDLAHFMRWFMERTSSRVAGTSSTFTYNTRTAATRARRTPLCNSKSRKTNKRKRQHDKDTNNYGAAGLLSGSSFEHTIQYRLLEYCSHLHSCSDDHGANEVLIRRVGNERTNCNLFNDYDKILLFLSMARSLGWRARYVMALEPIEQDLTVDHPLFVALSHHRNIFLDIWKAVVVKPKIVTPVTNSVGIPMDSVEIDGENETTHKTPTKSSKRTKVTPKSKSDAIKDEKANSCKPPQANLWSSLPHSGFDASPKPLCWVELLCQYPVDTSAAGRETVIPSTLNFQWIHVDPTMGIVNQPWLVEQALYVNHRQVSMAPNMTKKRRPIPYALSVEHLAVSPKTNDNDDSDTLNVRMADVTRRYAASMVESLQARGIEQSKRSRRSSGSIKEKKDWFTEFIHSQNFRNKSGNSRTNKSCKADTPSHVSSLKSKGKTRNDAIMLDDDEDDNVNKKPAAVTPDNVSLVAGPVHCGHDEQDDEIIEQHEERQLAESAQKEPLPTSKASFKKSPIYVIPSVLNSTEIFVPDAKKRVCGVFKGELVYLRSDVETAFPAKRWLYEGRKVRESELSMPVLKVKARKTPASKTFKPLKSYGVGNTNDGSEEARVKQIEDASQPLGDGKQHLYARWQTDPWSPDPVGPNDPIPCNEYNNVEVELLNPGLVHVDLERVAQVAKRLGLDYKPALLGFEGHGGNRTPTIRGIVVHAHNEELLREAHAEMASHLLEQEHENRQTAILRRWKRLLVGILTKDRLERDYGKDNT